MKKPAWAVPVARVVHATVRELGTLGSHNRSSPGRMKGQVANLAGW